MYKRQRRRSTTWSHERNNADRYYNKNRDNKSQAFHATDQPSSRGLTLIVYPFWYIQSFELTCMGVSLKTGMVTGIIQLVQQGSGTHSQIIVASIAW